MTWQCPPLCAPGPCAALIVLRPNADGCNVWRAGWGPPSWLCSRSRGPLREVPPGLGHRAPLSSQSCTAGTGLRLRTWALRDFRQMTLQQRRFEEAFSRFPVSLTSHSRGDEGEWQRLRWGSLDEHACTDMWKPLRGS